jgi:hypothetical protein
VFTKVDKLAELHKRFLGQELQILYRKGGVALLLVPARTDETQ